MVHVCCLREGCRRLIHLDNPSYWNFKGKVTCPSCGAVAEIEVRDGRILSFERVRVS
jgi:hypothetical protein